MRKILLLILFLLLPVSLLGQDISSGLKISTIPPGARVILDGDMTINGLTPIDFPRELNGKFKLTVRGDGYETYRQTLYLHPDRPIKLTLNLKPKTKFKAALRSLIIPGWGQRYSGNKGKGTLFTIMAIGASGYYYFADKDFYNKYYDYDLISSLYYSAKNEAEKAVLYSQLRTAKQKAYDAENKRLIAIGGVIGIWGLNLIDVLFFFPKEKGNMAVNSLTIKPNPDQDGAQIVFSHRF